MASGNLDIMLGSPMSYYQANQRAGAELLVSPENPTAEHNIYGVLSLKGIIKRLNDIEDIKGTNFGIRECGFFIRLSLSKRNVGSKFDLDPDLVEQSGYFFENVTFSESHPNSLMGVKMGDFEAAAVAAGV